MYFVRVRDCVFSFLFFDCLVFGLWVHCRLLSRKDIEVVVENGLPFLFKNSEESVRMMRLFLQSGDNNVSVLVIIFIFRCLCKFYISKSMFFSLFGYVDFGSIGSLVCQKSIAFCFIWTQ